jgi:transcriptional regulator with XRE-family HTH domain
LRQERQRAGLSQEELAFRANVDRTFVSRAERGERQPALATVLLLAEALDVPAAKLIASTVEMLDGGRTSAKQKAG